MRLGSALLRQDQGSAHLFDADPQEPELEGLIVDPKQVLDGLVAARLF